jgi:hypothetical protein
MLTENWKAMLNINSEFIIDSCRESGEEAVDDLGLEFRSFAHFLNRNSNSNPEVPTDC